MDEKTLQTLAMMNLSGVELLTVADLAQDDHRITAARENRSLVEFYFTAKSVLCGYLLKRVASASLVIYADADTFFFSSPRPMEEMMEGKSIGISPHRFPPELRYLQRFGAYNAGLLVFRADKHGRECLSWWTDRCLEWCHDFQEDGRYADQLYLDRFPSLFAGVQTLEHCGINLAPWNVGQHRLAVTDKGLAVDGHPLVLFHFHGLKRTGDDSYDTGLASYKVHLKGVLLTSIYQPYLVAIQEHEPTIWNAQTHGQERGPQRTTGFLSTLKALARRVRDTWYGAIVKTSRKESV